MPNCLFCYKPVENGEYHSACSKKFYGTSEVPLLDLNQEKFNQLARVAVSKRMALAGVQPKISLTLDGEIKKRRLTLVGLWGDFILKPQSKEYPHMPEVEDLTMHLAKLFKIESAKHALIRTSSGEIAYITKRFDRERGKKIHVEDLCQLSQLLTEQKYKSSYERVGKIIKRYTTNSGLDVIKYFRLVLFSFLTGNNDMHLKNFSLLHSDRGILLSPAYDLLNVNLIFPEDKEELALTLAGRKKRLRRSNFDQLATTLDINEIVRNNIYKEFSQQKREVEEWINRSFLTEQYKENYYNIVKNKMKQIEL